jgi:aminoglycoside phosphotransferase (APT) family kinase protein
VKERLQEYLQNAYPERKNLVVRSADRISDGWESELYHFTIQHGTWLNRKRERLILRIYPGDGAEIKAKHEFDNMKRLHETGYPVPRVIFLEEGSERFGHPFVIMEFIEGQPLWSLLSSSAEQEARRLISQFIELFIRLHHLDWRLFVEEPERKQWSDPFYFIDRWLEDARRMLDHSGVTEFLPIVDWLGDHRDSLGCEIPSAVHQDFHPNNVLVLKNGQGVVIDWTNFDISDKRFDLAWTLVLANSYEGMVVRNLILAEYERQSGEQVDQIEIFEVFACARRLFDILSSIAQGAERRGMRPEAVEMMKRQMPAHKRVYEMLATRTGIVFPTMDRFFHEES